MSQVYKGPFLTNQIRRENRGRGQHPCRYLKFNNMHLDVEKFPHIPYWQFSVQKGWTLMNFLSTEAAEISEYMSGEKIRAVRLITSNCRRTDVCVSLPDSEVLREKNNSFLSKSLLLLQVWQKYCCFYNLWHSASMQLCLLHCFIPGTKGAVNWLPGKPTKKCVMIINTARSDASPCLNHPANK